MHQIINRGPHFAAVLFMFIAASATSYAAIGPGLEAQFTLAPESRLPVMLHLPPNVGRRDVLVTLKYFTPAQGKADAALEMTDTHGKVLRSIPVEACWHPVMEGKKNKYGGFDPDTYPHYRYVRAKGEVEVIEHRREPVFRVSDDPALRRQAIAAPRCDKG